MGLTPPGQKNWSNPTAGRPVGWGQLSQIIQKIHARGGGGMTDVEDVRNYLLEKIDTADPVAIEKVDRYCSLMSMYYTLDAVVGDNVITIVKNGKQEFTKTNPAITEMAKINTQMINLSKDMGLSAPPPGAQAIDSKMYKSSDLV